MSCTRKHINSSAAELQNHVFVTGLAAEVQFSIGLMKSMIATLRSHLLKERRHILQQESTVGMHADSSAAQMPNAEPRVCDWPCGYTTIFHESHDLL
jgi:hypothetical protein